MHIGLCSPHWPPAEGANGIVSYVAAVHDHFVAQGHLVSLISQRTMYSSDGSETSLSLPERRPDLLSRVTKGIGRRLRPSPGALPEVGQKVAQEIALAHRLKPFDILEMEESFGWSTIVSRALVIPVVTRLHGPHCLKPLGIRSRAQRREDRTRCEAEARAIRSAALLTAPTKAILDDTCAKSGRDLARPAAVIANPIAIRPSSPRWRLSECERDHILMIGRFDYWKGADTLLLAFERLLRTRPAARLTLVGPDLGIEVRPGQTMKFDAFVREHLSPETRERIDFKGLLRPDEIVPLRLKANLIVVASRWESFSYVLLEGMVVGCPLITTDWPGSEDVILHGETGIRTPVGDPDAMAGNIESLLRNPDRAAALGAAGNRRCSRTFSVEVVGNRLLDCYHSALNLAA